MAERMHAGGQTLPLLELGPGILANHIVPLLQRRQQAALSLTCRWLHSIVALSVRELHFPGGRCCPAVQYDLQATFAGVQAIHFSPCNLHEAMNVVPSLMMAVGGGRRDNQGEGAHAATGWWGFLHAALLQNSAPPAAYRALRRRAPCAGLSQVGQNLPGLTRVVLQDRLPDDPSERRKCRDCNAWCNTCERGPAGG